MATTLVKVTKYKQVPISGASVVVFGCPECDNAIELSDYRIEPNGLVYPDVVCPYFRCRFAATVTLDKWRGAAK